VAASSFVCATAEYCSATVAFSIAASAITNYLVPRRLTGDTKKDEPFVVDIA
jgi:hypothetical protein